MIALSIINRSNTLQSMRRTLLGREDWILLRHVGARGIRRGSNQRKRGERCAQYNLRGCGRQPSCWVRVRIRSSLESCWEPARRTLKMDDNVTVDLASRVASCRSCYPLFILSSAHLPLLKWTVLYPHSYVNDLKMLSNTRKQLAKRCRERAPVTWTLRHRSPTAAVAVRRVQLLPSVYGS